MVSCAVDLPPSSGYECSAVQSPYYPPASTNARVCSPPTTLLPVPGRVATPVPLSVRAYHAHGALPPAHHQASSPLLGTS
eukprot:318457-Chlamydomonas_euryale.AAC.1